MPKRSDIEIFKQEIAPLIEKVAAACKEHDLGMVLGVALNVHECMDCGDDHQVAEHMALSATCTEANAPPTMALALEAMAGSIPDKVVLDVLLALTSAGKSKIVSVFERGMAAVHRSHQTVQ